MGDLDSLVQWHYLDPPDEFERRRNHTIFSSQFNPQYFTNNRNAYVDHPEFVWSIYVDQMNDSTITVAGGATNPDGSSMLEIDFGSVIVGSSVSVSQSVVLNKAGDDGTYYSVEGVGMGMSDAEGVKGAFRMDATDSRSIGVSLAYDQSAAGVYDGLVIVDNLDITTQGGAGNGANDGDDFINMSLTVKEHSNSSFEGVADVDLLSVDLGEIVVGEPISPLELSIHNLASQAGAPLTAGLELVSIGTFPAVSFLTYSGSNFTNLPAGQSNDFSIVGTPQDLGSGFVEFQFNLSDEAIPGATGQFLRLIIQYDVVDSPVLLGDVNLDGVVDFLDISPFIALLSNGGFQEEADLDLNGSVDFLDISPFIAALSGA